jgi:hypothetical protein
MFCAAAVSTARLAGAETAHTIAILAMAAFWTLSYPAPPEIIVADA